MIFAMCIAVIISVGEGSLVCLCLCMDTGVCECVCVCVCVCACVGTVRSLTMMPSVHTSLALRIGMKLGQTLRCCKVKRESWEAVQFHFWRLTLAQVSEGGGSGVDWGMQMPDGIA